MDTISYFFARTLYHNNKLIYFQELEKHLIIIFRKQLYILIL